MMQANRTSTLGAAICLALTLVIAQQQQANCFLFHQLQPAPQSAYNSENLTANNPINYLYPKTSRRQVDRQQQQQLFSQQHQQQQQFYQPQQPHYTQQQQNQAQPQPNYYLPPELTSGGEAEQRPANPLSCPPECTCTKDRQRADCSNRNLKRVPTGFPADIKRIGLERNNITELGPFSFNGLKRLQRIDLSNNNLVRIDPLAFAGGLQSLNSLILYSNKLTQLPVTIFSELSQLQLLLLNANSLQCITRELFQPLTNLNLLSLYDNNIETLANGTFDGLKSIKTVHLGKNPLICDCNLRWLADYLETNPVETSEARCESPNRNQAEKLSSLRKDKFRCEAHEQNRSGQLAAQCAATVQPQAVAQTVGQSTADTSTTTGACPAGCICDGTVVDCSARASQVSESRTGDSTGIYELPDVPEDVPVYVTRMKINDSRVKRIRQTGLFRRLANSQKLDLGNNKIVDVEDNAINGAQNGLKPERIVFVLLENELCSSKPTSGSGATPPSDDPCLAAPRVNPPAFDSPCYNGGTCSSTSPPSSHAYAANYTCACPTGFVGPLCEINIDDCQEHQCQNGALCVDGINTYKCVCRDPSTSGEFCEQLAPNPTGSEPVAMAMVAQQQVAPQPPAQSSAASAQSPQRPRKDQHLMARTADSMRTVEPVEPSMGTPSGGACKRVSERKFLEDGNGCQSAKPLKLSRCVGGCADWAPPSDSASPFNASSAAPCCAPAKVKRRRVRMQCNDGATYIMSVDLIKKCACSPGSMDVCSLSPNHISSSNLAAPLHNHNQNTNNNNNQHDGPYNNNGHNNNNNKPQGGSGGDMSSQPDDQNIATIDAVD